MPTRLPALAVIMASVAFGQAPDLTTPVSYARAVQERIKTLVTASAEKMPADQYEFRPAPEVRSFGEILGHIADAQYLFCSSALAETNPSPNIEKSKKSKSELTAALKEAFADCDRAYAALTDGNAADVIKGPGGGRARLGILSFNSTHAYEHYGNLVTYLRLKGIVPPSSERSN
jgi:uncharacterized damage-inducible protein DinB